MSTDEIWDKLRSATASITNFDSEEVLSLLRQTVATREFEDEFTYVNGDSYVRPPASIGSDGRRGSQNHDVWLFSGPADASAFVSALREYYTSKGLASRIQLY